MVCHWVRYRTEGVAHGAGHSTYAPLSASSSPLYEDAKAEVHGGLRRVGGGAPVGFERTQQRDNDGRSGGQGREGRSPGSCSTSPSYSRASGAEGAGERGRDLPDRRTPFLVQLVEPCVGQLDDGLAFQPDLLESLLQLHGKAACSNAKGSGGWSGCTTRASGRPNKSFAVLCLG